jgi:hypothetical protein
MADDERSTPETIAPPWRSAPGPSPPAADVEDLLAPVGSEIDQARQVVELLEVILIEVSKELPRPRGIGTDVEIVDVIVPVGSNCGVIGHRIASRGPGLLPKLTKITTTTKTLCDLCDLGELRDQP